MLGIECEHSTVKALQVLDRNIRVSVHPISIKAHQTILPSTTNPDRYLDRSKDLSCISLWTDCHTYHEKKKPIHQIQGNNNLRKKKIENQHTIKCWAGLSTNCCTPFWRSSLYTCVSIKSFIRLSSRPRTVACNKKILLVKYIYKKQLIIKKWM
jgi:hypothetical protein